MKKAIKELIVFSNIVDWRPTRNEKLNLLARKMKIQINTTIIILKNFLFVESFIVVEI